MLPPFNFDGNLPPGIHTTSWPEIRERFGRNTHRRALLEGVWEVLQALQVAGCKRAYLDGSFVTRKRMPHDFDMCWDEKHVDENLLEDVFFDFTQRCAAQKKRFGGEIYPANVPGGIDGWAFLDFFQICKRTHHEKGILVIDLTDLPQEI